MTEENSTPEPEVIHHGLTEAQLEEKVLEARNELKQMHAEHSMASDAKIAKQQELIDELLQDKADRKKADDDKAKAAGGGSTMVTPPAAMPAAQPSTPDPATAPSTEHHQDNAGRGDKPKFWKRAW